MAGLERPGKTLIRVLLIVITVLPCCPLLNHAVAETPASYDLLIIGPEYYRSILQSLIDFKAAQGVKTMFFPIEQISMNATGPGVAEKLHEFVAGEYEQSGVKYLLLVGTYEQVPTKYVYSPSDELGLADFNYKPSDWYYGVPDWSDSEVGLLGGNIPRIAVGRLPVRNGEELDRLIRKIIRVKTGFQPGLLLILNDPCVNAEPLAETLGAHYPACVNTTVINLDPSLLKNVTYLVTITHGSPDALFTRTPGGELKPLLTSREASRVTWDCTIHYMAACFSGALDLGEESLARVLVTSEEGPALVIASTRTESSGNPILTVFWERFFATGDVGRSFVEAVETYLLDERVFSTKPLFNAYNFYLTKAIYGDVSWRVGETGSSIQVSSATRNLNTPIENSVEDPSNTCPAEEAAPPCGGTIIDLLVLAFSSCILAAGLRISARRRQPPVLANRVSINRRVGLLKV